MYWSFPKNASEAKEAIIRVYLNYVAYCEELGVEFIAGYYDTKNQALNVAIRVGTAVPNRDGASVMWRKHWRQETIRLEEGIEEFTTDIRMIVIGNVFEWCLRSGEVDFAGNMRRSLSHYLDSVLR